MSVVIDDTGNGPVAAVVDVEFFVQRYAKFMICSGFILKFWEIEIFEPLTHTTEALSFNQTEFRAQRKTIFPLIELNHFFEYAEP